VEIQVHGFVHSGGDHCETSALRKLLAHQGLTVSEDLLLGLAGGVGFVYWQAKRMPTPFVGGRNGTFPDFLPRAAARLGARLATHLTRSARRGEARLRAELLAGRPALVYGDIAALPYFASRNHFGGHAFVVYGLDDARAEALISDRARRPCRIALDALRAARGALQRPFPPRHALVTVEAPASLPDLGPALREAIGECCEAMTAPPISNLGLAGIEIFARRVAAWPRRCTPPQLVATLRDTFVNLELAGTGGGSFRRMYARFLREAAAFTGLRALAEPAEMLAESAALWTRLALSLLPDARPELARLRSALLAKDEAFLEGGDEALARQQALAREIDRLVGEAAQVDLRAPEFLAESSARLRAIHALEGRAFAALRAVVAAPREESLAAAGVLAGVASGPGVRGAGALR
jgi:hypothetical protein